MSCWLNKHSGTQIGEVRISPRSNVDIRTLGDPRLLRSVVCVILRLAVLVQHLRFFQTESGRHGTAWHGTPRYGVAVVALSLECSHTFHCAAAKCNAAQRRKAPCRARSSVNEPLGYLCLTDRQTDGHTTSVTLNTFASVYY